jgi:hypothetical protein
MVSGLFANRSNYAVKHDVCVGLLMRIDTQERAKDWKWQCFSPLKI